MVLIETILFKIHCTWRVSPICKETILLSLIFPRQSFHSECIEIGVRGRARVVATPRGIITRRRSVKCL